MIILPKSNSHRHRDGSPDPGGQCRHSPVLSQHVTDLGQPGPVAQPRRVWRCHVSLLTAAKVGGGNTATKPHGAVERTIGRRQCLTASWPEACTGRFVRVAAGPLFFSSTPVDSFFTCNRYCICYCLRTRARLACMRNGQLPAIARVCSLFYIFMLRIHKIYTNIV